MTNPKVKRFEDLELSFDDVEVWTKIEDLVNQEVVIHDFIETTGEHGLYVLIKYTAPNEKEFKATTTGAMVIMKKLHKAKEMNVLPLLGKIIFNGKYYDIK